MIPSSTVTGNTLSAGEFQLHATPMKQDTPSSDFSSLLSKHQSDVKQDNVKSAKDAASERENRASNDKAETPREAVIQTPAPKEQTPQQLLAFLKTSKQSKNSKTDKNTAAKAADRNKDKKTATVQERAKTETGERVQLTIPAPVAQAATPAATAPIRTKEEPQKRINASSAARTAANVQTQQTAMKGQDAVVKDKESVKKPKEVAAEKTAAAPVKEKLAKKPVESQQMKNEAPRIDAEKPLEITVVKTKDRTDAQTASTQLIDAGKTSAAMKAEALRPVVQMQDIMPQLVERARVALANGKSEIELSLKPEALGKVKMKLSIEDGKFKGDIIVDNAAVKEMFERNIDSVVRSLSDMNLTVSGFTVSLKQDTDGGFNAYRNEFVKKAFSENGEVPMNETEMQTSVYAVTPRRLNIVI
ncbi:MAG: flagellar hook-length control protein FliK [Spirochaetes bacterium]|nr:flagellar hook-length control protein FliK [Spirochaetota bacterium]